MADNTAHVHHYVPEWYQKRFMPAGQEGIYYLDLSPEKVVSGPVTYMKKAVRFLHPARCFYVKDLYQLRFGKRVTDAMEKEFFGNVDRRGASAVEFCSAYDVRVEGVHEAYQGLVYYLGAQLFRTPRGLDWIKHRIGAADQTETLMSMSKLFQVYGAMWMEGTWGDLVRADYGE